MSKTLACLVLVVAMAVGGCATGPGGVPEPIVFQNPPPPMVPPTALAVPKPFIYPNRGQTAKQEEFDRGQCYSWAVQQSGFDPAKPPPATAAAAPPTTPTGTTPGAGAGGGGRGGVGGGVVGGDASTGAAVGAAAARGQSRRQNAAAANSATQQQQAATSQGQASFAKARAACLEGKGYTVK